MANLLYIDDHLGFSASVGHYSDFVFVSMPYQLRLSSTFIQSDNLDDCKVVVENMARIVKVKAGTFQNTLILKYPDGSQLYLAKGIGIIKSTTAVGNMTTELAVVKAGRWYFKIKVLSFKII